MGVSGLEPLNPKERIYSPPQLPLCDTPNLSPLPGSNQRPTDYKSVALPAELRRQYIFKKRLSFNLFQDIFPKSVPHQVRKFSLTKPPYHTASNPSIYACKQPLSFRDCKDIQTYINSKIICKNIIAFGFASRALPVDYLMNTL